MSPDHAEQRGQAEVLADAIAVLTEAARLTRPVLERDSEASDTAGDWVVKDTGRTEPADWAELVTLALTGAAANLGGIETALAGRPGSWEADGVRQLLIGTVGEDESMLLEHRTEPLVINLHVDEILTELGAWRSYYNAQCELAGRYGAIGIPTATGVHGDPSFEEELARLEPVTEEQERQAEAILEREARLDKQQRAEWLQYGEALRAHIEDAARQLPGLHVEVVVNVNVNVDTNRGQNTDDWAPSLASRLIEDAREATPIPGEDGSTPLERLAASGDEHLRSAHPDGAP